MESIDCLMFLKKGSRDLETDKKSVRQNLDVDHKANFRGSKVNHDKMAWLRPNGESTGKVYARLWRAAVFITVKGAQMIVFIMVKSAQMMQTEKSGDWRDALVDKGACLTVWVQLAGPTCWRERASPAGCPLTSARCIHVRAYVCMYIHITHKCLKS